MKKRRWFIYLLGGVALSAFAQFDQPYNWSRSIEGDRLVVQVEIPANAYLYADQTVVELSPSAEALQTPVAHPHTDEFGTAGIYEGGRTHRWVFSIDPNGGYKVLVTYQGCGEPTGGGGAVCYPPASEEFSLGQTQEVAGQTPASEEPVNELGSLLDRFETVRADGGIKTPDEFLVFLDKDAQLASSSSMLEGKSILAILFFVLVGGLALNLTPCVLPMIPVNLAIIGAGAEAADKKQGFVRGGVYGLGIAVAYGALGLFTVLTGSKFGTLNASPVFNFVIAAVFLLLTLALFDVLQIDLSRFGTKFGISNDKRGKLLPAFAMGVVAALLAGACVAPIVIAVLLQATTLYAAGNAAGLFLPLLLGIGMALPWPIAGAGLTVLPKPGMWMEKVKHGFGILILLFAAYYAWLGVTLLPKASSGGHTTQEAIVNLKEQLTQALETEQPVFIDFWATWCKNCLKMEKTTFKDSAVQERLAEFAFIKFQAEDIGDPRIKELLDRYNLPGLPGYVILQPPPTP